MLAATPQAMADDSTQLARNNYGGVGLIDMPSARMSPDGQLSFGGSYFGRIERYNLSFQALPWLEVVFRYSGLGHYTPEFPVYFDRSFALKARLWDETDLFPAVSLGVNDLVGTGIYSGEYLVASKRFGDFDTSLGVGWGRLASVPAFHNPLASLFPSFEQRALETSGVGQFSPKSYFRGHNVGVFGGVQWHTPIDGLSLIGEYSSDAYTAERNAGTFLPRNHFNFGASYAVSDDVSVGLNWLYGRNFGFNLSIHTDPTTPLYPQKIASPPTELHVRTQAEQRVALIALIESDGHADKITRQAVGHDRVALVDGLWNSGFTDVSLQGRTLALAARKQPSPAQCQAIAEMAASYGTDISVISVSVPEHAQLRCAVAHRVQPVLILANANDTDLINLAAMPADLKTIDARPVVVDRVRAERQVRAEAGRQGIFINALSLRSGEAIIYYGNNRYFHEKEAVERLVRILMADAPADIEKFRIVAMGGGVPQREFTILRSVAERSLDQEGRFEPLSDGGSVTSAAMRNPVLAKAERHDFPRFTGGLSPQFRQQLFDPSSPLGVQLVADAAGAVELAQGLSLGGILEATLFQNFSQRQSDSQLPHVRTDFQQYLRKKIGIVAAQANYDFRLTPELYGNLKGGLLETMFAGAGGQLLYRPEGQRWALGADAYDVYQRDFGRLFGLQPYHTFTGHVSLYYSSPWYNLDFVFRAGQYLAGDRGYTIQVTRRFASGVEIGGFFTKTNVSVQQFGEGSFDKGIIIRIPLEWLAPLSTQAEVALDLRPVQRDGGQRLLGDDSLYDITSRASEAEIQRSMESP